MVIQHNILAHNANRQLGIVSGRKASFTEKLSSGYRINRSADDAAGLSISEKMRRQIRGLTQGIANTEDGISLCQVADGALAEVHEMLQRINELSVQAANGTNSASDRSYIQDEVSALITEIDRIGDTTSFNEIKIFKGEDSERHVVTAIGGAVVGGNVSKYDFSKISMDCALDKGPFDASSEMRDLNIVASDGSDVWELIYGGGYTSISNIRGKYVANGQTKSFLYQFGASSSATVTDTIGNYQASESNGVKTWSRDLNLQNADGLDLTIRQTAKLNPKEVDSQYFTISYDVINNSNFSVTYDLLQNIDIAYNNYDFGENYYLNSGDKVDKFSMYTTNSKYTAMSGNADIHNGIPSDFSVINVDEPLGFTEKIVLNGGDGGTMADTVVFGPYDSAVFFWSHYDNASDLDNLLGNVTEDKDVSVNLMWHGKILGAGASTRHSYKQGIYDTLKDPNIASEQLKFDSNALGKMVVYDKKSIWIQSGCDVGDGIILEMEVMNAEVLGMDKLSVLTEDDATEAIDTISYAVGVINKLRSRIGAYQNRLEHTIKNESNIVENTTASESKIRDTDMASMMVEYSKAAILEQVGQSMLAQANQSAQGCLALLS